MFRNILKYLQKLPAFLRNKYFLSVMAFAVWMVFFDDNNLIEQLRLTAERNNMEEKMAYFRNETDRVEKEKNDLFSSPENLERYARENYWMKKDDEDLFIITDSQEVH